ncbi:hypothetical protein BGX34_005514 [Mortierella sp. NVP85]|nr:hypothetical protein BGX34_005514 [Mortierella sp. NVP85]
MTYWPSLVTAQVRVCTSPQDLPANIVDADVENVIKAWSGSESISNSLLFNGQASIWLCTADGKQTYTESNVVSSPKASGSSGTASIQKVILQVVAAFTTITSFWK